ncbi:unnamed protein product [Protopolystoma xenopodis]|uniref:Uncharacterized protein n=1 Tax=Protopolystoma xenopodis TaxID=117903 RepID=A0A3S5BRV3_9PLAT|nr:unnamed protein product [Protopolystoma xenopodis]
MVSYFDDVHHTTVESLTRICLGNRTVRRVPSRTNLQSQLLLPSVEMIGSQTGFLPLKGNLSATGGQGMVPFRRNLSAYRLFELRHITLLQRVVWARKILGHVRLQVVVDSLRDGLPTLSLQRLWKLIWTLFCAKTSGHLPVCGAPTPAGLVIAQPSDSTCSVNSTEFLFEPNRPAHSCPTCRPPPGLHSTRPYNRPAALRQHCHVGFFSLDAVANSSADTEAST